MARKTYFVFDVSFSVILKMQPNRFLKINDKLIAFSVPIYRWTHLNMSRLERRSPAHTGVLGVHACTVP